MKDKIIELFDDEKYEEVYNITNPYKKKDIVDYEILYFLKSKLALNDFKIEDVQEIKKLFFYYFYLYGKVDFDNNYSFYFKKESLDLSFNNLEKEIDSLVDFKQYFLLGKNDLFLNKISDSTIVKEGGNYREGTIQVDNIIDFFISFTHECSELYAFSGEHFPLFKWLVNKIINAK